MKKQKFELKEKRIAMFPVLLFFVGMLVLQQCKETEPKATEAGANVETSADTSAASAVKQKDTAQTNEVIQQDQASGVSTKEGAVQTNATATSKTKSEEKTEVKKEETTVQTQQNNTVKKEETKTEVKTETKLENNSTNTTTTTQAITKTDNWPVPDNYKTMKNPYPATQASLDNGKELFAQYCKSCHGAKGLGDGTKAAQLETKIKSFHSAEFKAQSPGVFYYKAMYGKDEMPKFIKKIITEEERWAIINYILTL